MSKRPRVNHPSGVRWRSITPNHPALAAFSAVPRHRDLFGWLTLAGPIVPFLAVWLLVLPLLSLPFAKENNVAGILAISGLATGVAALFAGQTWARRTAARRLRQREEALLPPQAGEHYVGVIYSDHLYLTPDGAWDRGWLHVEQGELAFRGFATLFRLPLASLSSVELLDPKTDRPSFVLVRWSSPDGSVASLALQSPDAANARESRDQARRLTELIQRPAGTIASSITPIWPPFIPSDRIYGGPTRVLQDPQLRSSLKRRALGVGILTTVVSTAVLMLLSHTPLKPLAVALGPVPVCAGIVVGALSLERRAKQALKAGADRILEDRRPSEE